MVFKVFFPKILTSKGFAGSVLQMNITKTSFKKPNVTCATKIPKKDKRCSCMQASGAKILLYYLYDYFI